MAWGHTLMHTHTHTHTHTHAHTYTCTLKEISRNQAHVRLAHAWFKNRRAEIYTYNKTENRYINFYMPTLHHYITLKINLCMCQCVCGLWEYGLDWYYGLLDIMKMIGSDLLSYWHMYLHTYQ